MDPDRSGMTDSSPHTSLFFLCVPRWYPEARPGGGRTCACFSISEIRGCARNGARLAHVTQACPPHPRQTLLMDRSSPSHGAHLQVRPPPRLHAHGRLPGTVDQRRPTKPCLLVDLEGPASSDPEGLKPSWQARAALEGRTSRETAYGFWSQPQPAPGSGGRQLLPRPALWTPVS